MAPVPEVPVLANQVLAPAGVMRKVLTCVPVTTRALLRWVEVVLRIAVFAVSAASEKVQSIKPVVTVFDDELKVVNVPIVPVSPTFAVAGIVRGTSGMP